MLDAPITTVLPARTVRLVLGDQLNASHPWWSDSDDQVLTVMMECRQETDYAQHHVQKVLAFFLAMREFAKSRMEEGHRMHYLPISGAHATRPMICLLYTSPSPRDLSTSRMPSSA